MTMDEGESGENKIKMVKDESIQKVQSQNYFPIGGDAQAQVLTSYPAESIEITLKKKRGSSCKAPRPRNT